MLNKSSRKHSGHRSKLEVWTRGVPVTEIYLSYLLMLFTDVPGKSVLSTDISANQRSLPNGNCILHTVNNKQYKVNSMMY